MATKRTRRPRHHRAPVDPEVIEFLKDNAEFTYFATDQEIRSGWDQMRDEILADWAKKRPGTRPRAWWRFDAKEMRQRLGGTGQAAFEVLAHVEAYHLGIPTSWVEPRHADLYGPDFAGVPIDPEDPPLYESQGTYLKRLGLLLPGERKRLSPDDFEPEFIASEADPDEGEAA